MEQRNPLNGSTKDRQIASLMSSKQLLASRNWKCADLLVCIGITLWGESVVNGTASVTSAKKQANNLLLNNKLIAHSAMDQRLDSLRSIWFSSV